VTDLADNALTDLDAIAGELPGYTKGATTADDDRITRYINAASDLFEDWTGRSWHYVSGYTERARAYGTAELIVEDHLPIDTVNSVTWDNGDFTDTVDADDYEVVKPESGEVRKINGIWPSTALHQAGTVQKTQPGSEQPLYVVDYDGGYVTPKDATDTGMDRTLPWHIEQAVIAFVVMRESMRGQNPAVSSISMDDGSIDFVAVRGRRVPTQFASAADQYAGALT